MTRLSTLSWGQDQFRVGPWHAEDGVAYVAVPPNVLTPSPTGVTRLVDHLRSSGYRRVLTAALRDSEVGAFQTAGFSERERLVVLSHDLKGIAAPTGEVAMRRPRPGERPTVLAIDAAAFEHGWRLDRHGLAEAVAATPRTRFRVAIHGGPIGYAICGRADEMGYLQRLAVDPAAQRHGIGRALVLDALYWLRRRGARLALVNTQTTNDPALTLYAGCGFTREPSRLVVLERTL